MNPLHFILFVLLGFLASSAAAVPRQPIGLAAGDTGQDADRTAGRELEARQGFPSSLLQEYDLKCALDRAKTPIAPGMSGSFLTAAYCKKWFVCQSDGTKKATDKKPSNQPWKLEPENRDWCKDWCECVVIDEPQSHPFYNFGCVNPVNKQIPGNFGRISRDTASPPGSDGLVMEAFEGPPRKD